MKFNHVFIPYGAYWSTPFVRWQGRLATQHPIKLAASVGRDAMEERGIERDALDSVVLGVTVPSKQQFWGAPWLAHQMGMPGITGPTVSQACATAAQVVATGAAQVELGGSAVLGVTCDRTSNGPHIYYPDGTGPGGQGQTEDWVWDNIVDDPHTKEAVVETAERVAAEAGITREEQDALTLRRYEQYAADFTPGATFQQRYLVAVQLHERGRALEPIVDDEGVVPTTAEGLAKLAPIKEGGTVTFGTQTHPADANAAIVMTNRETSERLSRDPSITIALRSFGVARMPAGFMPKAPVPAARAALDAAGLGVADLRAIKTHNPFAVNDLYLARELGLDAFDLNNHGSSLIYGHPQSATGMRLIIELIEELVDLGGGHGLFTGCAAGDTAAAIVVTVG